MPKEFSAGYITLPWNYVPVGEVQMLMNPLSHVHPVYLLLNVLQRFFCFQLLWYLSNTIVLILIETEFQWLLVV